MKTITTVLGRGQARGEANSTWRMVTAMAPLRVTLVMAIQYNTAALLPGASDVMNVKMTKMMKCGRTRHWQSATFLLLTMLSHREIMSKFVGYA
jgi:hypothetical protein